MAVQLASRSSAMTMHATKEEQTARGTAVDQMKANLIRYARTDDRRMLLRSLRDSKLLNCLSLDAVQSSDGQLYDLEKECAATRIILNGVEIKGIGLHSAGSEDDAANRAKISCIPVLKGLCRLLSEKAGVKISSRELYEKLIVRLAKSTSSADPYFRLNSLFGSPDLLVMPLEDETATDGDKSTLTEMNVYACNGEIHVTFIQTYKFGLLRKADVKTNRPWVIIHGVAKERTNLTRNSGVRALKVVLPDM